MNLKSFYRYIFLVLVSVVFFTGCGSDNDGGGFTYVAPVDNGIDINISSAKLISVSSASTSKVGVDWLPSDSASKTNISYEVHMSKTKAFPPTTATLKATTTNDNYEVDGLDANTLYYVMVVAKASNGESANSIQLPVKTASIDPKLKANINVVTQDDKDIKSVTDTNITTSSEIKVGDFIVNAKHNYLRKVTNVSNQNGEYVAQTEKSTLGKIFSDLEFSTAFKLEDTSKSNAVSKRSYQKSGNLISIESSSYNWSSGLTMSTERFIQNNKSINKLILKQQKTTISNDKISAHNPYFEVSIPASMAVDVGDELKQKIFSVPLKRTLTWDPWSINKSDCDKVGGTYNTVGDNDCINTPVKICSIQIDDVDEPNEASSTHRMEIRDGNILYWLPNDNNIDREYNEPYKVDLKISIGIGDCSGDKADEGGTLKLKNIKLTASQELPSSIVYKNTVNFSNEDKTITFDNEFTAEFSPEIIFDGKFLDDDLNTATAKIKANFSIQDIAKLKTSLQKNHTFTPKALYRKSFIKVVQAGPVPIVFTGELKFMAIAEIDANAEVEATLDMETGLELEYGMEYKNDNWSLIQPKKEITYRFTAGAKGDASTKITVKLIPDFSIEVYKLAAAQLLVEPYLYSNVGIHGEVTAQFSSENSYQDDATAEFTKLNAGIGLDLKVYAGAAWNTNFKFLKWPEKATYANSIDFDFMGTPTPKHAENMMKYYDAIKNYTNYTILKETNITSIPILDMVFDYSEIPPLGMDSRAIKIKGSYENIESPLYTSFNLGKQYYIEFDKWDNPVSVLSNAKIHKAEVVGEYWLIPEILDDGKMEETKVRLVAHSNLGSWARQTTNKNLLLSQVTTSNGKYVPQYWIDKYLGGSFIEDGDKDGDKYSNLLEYLNGTSPDNSKDYPTSVNPDISRLLLAAPTDLNGTSSNNEVSLTWNIVSNATEYQICMAEESIVNPSNCSSYIGGKLIDILDTNKTIKNLVNDKTYYFTVKGVSSGYDGVWSSEINIIVKNSIIPEDAKEINLCANQTAYLEKEFTLGMSLNTQSITGNVFEKSEDFTGAAFCGEFAGTTSSEEVLNKLRNSFSDASNVVRKNNADGSLKVTYEMIGENVQAYSLLKSVLEESGVSDFSTYVDYSAHTAISDVQIDLFIKYINSSTVYVILAVTDKAVDNTDDLNTLVDDSSIAETQTVQESKTDEFTYTANSLKADILFIMDDSGSMSNEQSSASQAIIDTFGTAMSSKGIDWKATVIGTENNRNYSSHVQNFIENDITGLASQLSNIGLNGGDEVGLKIAYTYLNNSSIIIRDNSKLSIVYISDEIEHTRLSDLGVSNISDSYFVVNNIKVNVIITENEYNRNNDLAYQMANATGGEVANLRNYTTGYNAMMQKIADDSAGSASEIILSEIPIVATINVTINDIILTKSNWNYNSDNNSISFVASFTPSIGDKIKVVYKY
ncbi:MAG TPA: fibronectin type III domain-containing protein [Sulfurimonas sp.]|nr:fibronectin type III domain-containing protein [Sulfurimonas sp.]